MDNNNNYCGVVVCALKGLPDAVRWATGTIESFPRQNKTDAARLAQPTFYDRVPERPVANRRKSDRLKLQNVIGAI